MCVCVVVCFLHNTQMPEHAPSRASVSVAMAKAHGAPCGWFVPVPVVVRARTRRFESATESKTKRFHGPHRKRRGPPAHSDTNTSHGSVPFSSRSLNRLHFRQLCLGKRVKIRPRPLLSAPHPHTLTACLSEICCVCARITVNLSS